MFKVSARTVSFQIVLYIKEKSVQKTFLSGKKYV